ncbi:MAG TPA: hypothetical protein VEB68_10535 [Croceibacterium sp.]|nr:hypothetical protein [Croceibacterium sp.]
MKTLIASALALAAAPLAAAAPVSLPGVSDEETTIAGGVTDYHFGHGDVLFVRDRIDRWYRVQLNEGCLKTRLPRETAVFAGDAIDNRVDTFTQVIFVRDQRMCGIDSIRRSAAPPQVDRNSLVTLD